ncbi:UTRA domain-containing protein [Micromonospora pisi]|uniref:UTRA domain-containing protein n=1 Tax=Micromonospora pisi TaxID=589240 RepID=UPI002482632E|nr:UTRA domain-containing protein [Micromonospora pisi]
MRSWSPGCGQARSRSPRSSAPPGAEPFEKRRPRYPDNLIVVLENSQLPPAICAALASTDFTTASLYAALRVADSRQLPQVARYTVEARQPTGPVAGDPSSSDMALLALLRATARRPPANLCRRGSRDRRAAYNRGRP